MSGFSPPWPRYPPWPGYPPSPFQHLLLLFLDTYPSLGMSWGHMVTKFLIPRLERCPDSGVMVSLHPVLSTGEEQKQSEGAAKELALVSRAGNSLSIHIWQWVSIAWAVLGQGDLCPTQA